MHRALPIRMPIESRSQEEAHPPHLVIQRHAHDTRIITSKGDPTEEARYHQPPPAPHLTVEEVRGQQDIEMETDELVPGGGLLPLWCWWNAMMLEDIPDALITNRVSQVGQGSHNAVIAPRTVLSSHPHHQRFDLFVNAGTAHRLGWCRGANLLLGARAVPGEDGVGLGNSGDLFQALLAQLLANLGECSPLVLRELHAPLDLLAQNAILCDEVYIAKPELFVHRRSDRPQQLFPIHASFHPCHDVLPYCSVWGSAWGNSRGDVNHGQLVTFGRITRSDILTIQHGRSHDAYPPCPSA